MFVSDVYSNKHKKRETNTTNNQRERERERAKSEREGKTPHSRNNHPYVSMDNQDIDR